MFHAPHDRPSPQSGELGIVSTPIGNLGDITLRAVQFLQSADLILAEDTRHSRQLLNAHNIAKPLVPYHEHNGAEMRPKVLVWLGEGKRLALISDAGAPTISDPGFKLVRDCAAAGFRITPLPGPSAPIAALTASGLPSDRFAFIGFLPAKPPARREEILRWARWPATLICFEAPQRLVDSLADLAQALGPRQAVIAREMTKMYEHFERGALAHLAAWARAQSDIRGEITLIIGPPDPDPAASDEASIDLLLRDSLPRLSLKDAVQEVAIITGAPRKQIYDRALSIRDET